MVIMIKDLVAANSWAARMVSEPSDRLLVEVQRMTVPASVIFLGNPGKEYEQTRHNAGFLVANRWSRARDLVWQQKFKGEWASLNEGRKIFLLRPLTFMNLVGESARALGDFFRVAPESWLAVHDDIDLPFGEVRFQTGGGLGGHNGLRSLKQHLGTDGFHRLRLGIGRPTKGDVASFVLGRFTPDEEIELERIINRAISTLEQALDASL
jgi:PTH1 family peptidyl-tRNA hydrolase